MPVRVFRGKNHGVFVISISVQFVARGFSLADIAPKLAGEDKASHYEFFDMRPR